MIYDSPNLQPGQRPATEKTLISYVYDDHTLLTIEYYKEASSFFVEGKKKGQSIPSLHFVEMLNDNAKERHLVLQKPNSSEVCPVILQLVLNRIHETHLFLQQSDEPYRVKDLNGNLIAELLNVNFHKVFIHHRHLPLVPLIDDIGEDNEARVTACKVESYLLATQPYMPYCIFPNTTVELKRHVTLSALLLYPYNLVDLVAKRLPLLEKNLWERICEKFEVWYYRYKYKQ